MSSDNQIDIPPSFIALYITPGREFPNAAHGEILSRYEFCEDLANMLVTPTFQRVAGRALSESDVLERCYAGLLQPDGPLTDPEARWVVSRLAELIS